ncbi:MAG: hypothetical protein ACR5K4_02535 [Sodalis sp. (in: enterobacteria)]
MSLFASLKVTMRELPIPLLYIADFSKKTGFPLYLNSEFCLPFTPDTFAGM